jgi:hypothetical protein
LQDPNSRDRLLPLALAHALVDGATVLIPLLGT